MPWIIESFPHLPSKDISKIQTLTGAVSQFLQRFNLSPSSHLIPISRSWVWRVHAAMPPLVGPGFLLAAHGGNSSATTWSVWIWLSNWERHNDKKSTLTLQFGLCTGRGLSGGFISHQKSKIYKASVHSQTGYMSLCWVSEFRSPLRLSWYASRYLIIPMEAIHLKLLCLPITILTRYPNCHELANLRRCDIGKTLQQAQHHKPSLLGQFKLLGKGLW